MYEKSVVLLNKALADELAAIHQYLYFHFHCSDQGLDLLAGLFKKAAMAEMGHVEKLSERILFLKGDLEMTISSEVKKIKTVKEMLRQAKDMEMRSIKDYNQWANECMTNADTISRQLFEILTASE